MTALKYPLIRAAFVTFSHRIEADALESAVARYAPEVTRVRIEPLDLFEWPSIEVMHPVQNAWFHVPTIDVAMTNRAFGRNTREGAYAVVLSPSEALSLQMQEVIADQLDGDALAIDVSTKEFFERLPNRLGRYSEVTGDPQPYLTFGGLLAGRGDTNVVLDFPDVQTDQWKAFQEMIQSSWPRMYENLDFKAAYITINGIEINMFANGSAAIFTDSLGDALDASRVASVLFDFQLTTA
jgi:hypothetical protein